MYQNENPLMKSVCNEIKKHEKMLEKGLNLTVVNAINSLYKLKKNLCKVEEWQEEEIEEKLKKIHNELIDGDDYSEEYIKTHDPEMREYALDEYKHAQGAINKLKASATTQLDIQKAMDMQAWHDKGIMKVK
jgi:protein subunit release factor A